MDWREMAGHPTVRGMMQGEGRWSQYTSAWSGGKKIGHGLEQWNGRGIDPIRGWIIALCWLLACSAEYVLPSSFFSLTRLTDSFCSTVSITYMC